MSPSRVPDVEEVAEDVRDLALAVRSLEVTVNTRFTELSTTFLPREVYEAYHSTLRAEVARIDDRLTWAWRTAVAGLLLPIMVSIIVALVMTLGRT